jgi:hypothetical protein
VRGNETLVGGRKAVQIPRQVINCATQQSALLAMALKGGDAVPPPQDLFDI